MSAELFDGRLIGMDIRLRAVGGRSLACLPGRQNEVPQPAGEVIKRMSDHERSYSTIGGANSSRPPRTPDSYSPKATTPRTYIRGVSSRTPGTSRSGRKPDRLTTFDKVLFVLVDET